MSIRRGLALSFGRTGFVFFIQFGSNIALARLLLPSEIGIFSVAVAATAILHALREFGIGSYLIKEPELTDDKVQTSFGIAILIGWSLAALVFTQAGERFA